MVETTNAAINAAADEEGMECHDSEQGCPYCERKGLPILPVRYAVCVDDEKNSRVKELPEDRVAQFTGVQLNKSKYILRQLRPGYFYLFDKQNPLRWFAYRVTQDGLFEQFPVLSPEKYVEKSNHCPEDQQKMLHASIITLPTIETSESIYWAYTDYPWPESLIKELGKDDSEGEALRQKMMQKIDNIQSWADGGSNIDHAFDGSELDLVAEFGPAPYAVDGHFISNDMECRLVTPDDMQNLMQSKLDRAAGRYQGRGLVLGVKDEIGVLLELNAYRHETQGVLEDFLKEGDNLRKALCCDVIDALDDGFIPARTMQIEAEAESRIEALNKERDESIDPLGTARKELEQAEAEGNREAIESKRRLVEYLERNGNPVVAEESNIYHRKRRERIEREKQDALGSVGEDHANYMEQLRDYFDTVAYESFSNDYRHMSATAAISMVPFDRDYSMWLSNHLGDALNRYDRKNLWCGIGMCHAVLAAMHGGAMSHASTEVWLEYARNLDDDDSPIIRLLFANSDELIAKARVELGSLGETSWFGKETLNSWKEYYSDLYTAQYEERLTNQSIGEDPQLLANEYDAVNGNVIRLIGNSLMGLAVNEASGHEQASGAGDATKTFIRLSQLSRVGGEEIQFAEGALPLFVTVQMKASEYHYWLTLIQRYGSRAAPSLDETAGDATKSEDGSSGLFSIPFSADDTIVDVAVPALSEDLFHALTDNAEMVIYNDKGLEDRRKSTIYSSALEIAKKLSEKHPGSSDAYQVYSTYSNAETIRKYNDEDKKNDPSLMKIVGASASLLNVGITLARNSSFLQYHVAMAGVVNSSTTIGWKIVAGTIGKVGDTLAFIEGLQQVSDAGYNRKIGRSSGEVWSQIGFGTATMVAASLGLSGALVGVALGSPLFIFAVVLAGMTVALGLAATKLVSDAVVCWMDRCYLGHNTSQLTPFASAQEENASLDLLMEGVSIQVVWEDIEAASRGAGVSVDALNNGIYSSGKKITIKAKVPDLSKMTLSMRLERSIGSRTETVFDNEFEKKSDRDFLKEARTREIAVGEASAEDMSGFDVMKEKDFYFLEKTVYESGGDVERMELVVDFYDERFSTIRSGDVFLLEGFA